MPVKKKAKIRKKLAKGAVDLRALLMDRRFLAAALVILVVYVWLTPSSAPFNAPMRLAKQMLQGSLSFPVRHGGTEMYEWQGRFYIAYPPMVSLLAVPIAAFMPGPKGMPYFLSLLMFGSAILMYVLLSSLPALKKAAVPGMVFYALGTSMLYSVLHPSVWLLMHAEANFFLLLSLCLAFNKKLPFLAGMAFGIAASCRLFVGFSIVAFIFFYWDEFRKKDAAFSKWRTPALFACGMLVPFFISLLFHYLMTGNPFKTPYEMVFKEWNKGKPVTYFQFDRYFLTARLKLYLFGLPRILHRFPYLTFQHGGQPLWTLSPFLLGVLPALWWVRGKQLGFAAGAGILLTLYILFGGSGDEQFGTRYLTDALPYLIPFALLGFKPNTKVGRWIFLAFGVISVAHCCFGVYVTRNNP